MMPEFEFPQRWHAWLTQYELYDNSVGRWLAAVGVFLLAMLTLFLVRSILVRRAEHWAKLTRSDWDDALFEALQRTKGWFLIIVAAFVASFVLVFPVETRDRTKDLVQTVVILALLVQLGLWGNVLITSGVGRYVKRRTDDDPASVMTITALAFLGKVVLFSLLLLLALDNLGIEVTALITGLGVGGIAVALAVQNILGDLLASLSIVFDKPFVLGDFIIVGSEMGTVERIGLKTTRVRSLSGEQLVFPNNDLLQSRIRNYKRMAERRVVFSLGVTYDTPREKLEQIPQVIREVIEARDQVRFDRAHFQKFGDFSLIFEIVYYMLTPDYNRYMDIQQAINLALYERFEQMGVEFAFPTQTLFLEKAPAE
jgi:small-conductance mechanosensitive channel